MSLYDTGVRCSAFDETLVVPLDGTSVSSLLVSPAFDPSSTSQTPLPDDQRNEYFSLEYIVSTPAGSLQPTGLPRDRFQRWHDQNCRNLAIGASFPVFGAGPGNDRLVDINGDGLVDVLRFELDTGDGHANLANIQAGLKTSWDYRDSCQAAPAHQNAGVRIYRNHGDGNFVPDPDFFFTLNGIPHASYWLNWLGGDLIDINGDARTDFLLPIDTDPADSNSTFTVYYTRPSGDYAHASLAVLSAWARYDDDNTWQENLRRLGAIRMVRLDSTGTFLVLGDRVPSDPGMQLEASRWFREGQWPRIANIEDGLGAMHQFSYGPYVDTGARVELPAGRMTAPKTVVRQHITSVGPDASLEPDEEAQVRRTCYRFSGPIRALRSGRFLGFEETVTAVTHGQDSCVIFEESPVDPPDSRTRRIYDFSFDAAVEAYPHAAAPTVVESDVWVENGSGVVQRRRSCEAVLDWEVRTPDGGATWFSYPSSTRRFTMAALLGSCEKEADSSDPFPQDVTSTETRNDAGAVVKAVEEVADFSTTTTTFSDWLDDDPAVDTHAHWFRGKARQVDVTSCGSGNWGNLAECQTRTERFSYDAPEAEVDSVMLQPGDAQLELTTEFERNGHGRVISKTRTNASGVQRGERFGWDAEGVHMEWSSNALGQRSFVIHDHPTGALVSRVEPNGTAVETVYDGFLRPVEVHKQESPMGAFSPVHEEIA